MRKYTKNAKDSTKPFWQEPHGKTAHHVSMDLPRIVFQRVRRTLSQPAKRSAS